MLLLALACRPDPGNPTYPDPGSLSDIDTSDPDFYSGPDPYVSGEDRLSLGAFYEGGYSELMPVDDVTLFYYIYSNTFTQIPDDTERIEGYASERFTISSVGWWGAGIHSNAGVDLSAWTTVHVSAKSADIDNFALHMQSGEEGVVQAAAYGFAGDGEWHTMDIPISSFAGVDSSTLTGLLLFIGESDPEGSVIYFDNIYFTAD